MHIDKPFGEIIESSLNIFKAQCWQWDQFPTFGSLVTVKTTTKTLFAIVHTIETGSFDSNRTVFAYQKTEEELKREQPQIFEFLCTTFSCLIIGYKEDNKIIYQLPPEPPKIHTFVHNASNEDSINFFSQEHYLPLLFSYAHITFSLDELLLALLKNIASSALLDNQSLAKFIETFSLLTANDYRRLKLFLQRAQILIKPNYALESHL